MYYRCLHVLSMKMSTGMSPRWFYTFYAVNHQSDSFIVDFRMYFYVCVMACHIFQGYVVTNVTSSTKSTPHQLTNKQANFVRLLVFKIMVMMNELIATKQSINQYLKSRATPYFGAFVKSFASNCPDNATLFLPSSVVS